MVILDIELYKDYLLIYFKDLKTGKYKYYEMFPGQPLDIGGVKAIMERNTTVTFNGNGYDLPLIVAALEGWDNKHLKAFSDSIIKSNKPSWSICKTNNIVVPDSWDTIDLISVAPGIASLKLYGARLGAPRIQDLPIDPDDSIEPGQREELRTYCINDLSTTELLFNTLKPQIDLRVSMSAQYELDLRSKSDPQVAEAVIAKELEKKTGRKYRPLKLKDGATIRYQDPQIVSFKDQTIHDIFEKILTHEFEFLGNGSIKLPKWLKDTKIKIGNSVYQMGIGGLHSCEKSQYIEAGDKLLLDVDVSSYYPNLILRQNLAPKSMGPEFLNLYKSIVDRRLKAKASGDKVGADSGKLQINGSFGKLGSKYSILYAPELLLQTTITGQLCLLMLISRLEDAGISVVSGNTDGIVCHLAKQKEHDLETEIWDWELDTSFELERTDYRLIASRDINNYFAITTVGKIKRKGCFANGGLNKNPNQNIIYTAVIEFIKNGTPLEQTIRGCDDINQFVTCRKVTGGCTFNGEKLGKTVRFYSATDSFFIDPCIHYTLNGNRVAGSGGCKPIMDISGGLPADINYGVYVENAQKLLLDVGFK